jgi:spore coat polysaccharide biosynthesis protein SpsF
MKTAAILQARVGSTRLPGKILASLGTHPLLEVELQRLKKSKFLDTIIVATTEDLSDDPVIDLCQRLEVRSFRGSCDDVLDRYHRAARAYEVSTIVRITGDCPLIDAAIVDRCLALYRSKEKEIDYVSNCVVRTYARGMDVEIFGRTTLDRVHAEASDASDREHVTTYIRSHPKIFRCADELHSEDWSHVRLTVDTREDLELVRKVFNELTSDGNYFSYEDILDLLRRHPDWLTINQHIRQKGPS